MLVDLTIYWHEPANKTQETEAYDAYHEKLFVHDSDNAPRLKSSMTNIEYLEAISAPRVDPSGKRRKPPMTKKQRAAIEVAEVADENAERQGQQNGPTEQDEPHGETDQNQNQNDAEVENKDDNTKERV